MQLDAGLLGATTEQYLNVLEVHGAIIASIAQSVLIALATIQLTITAIRLSVEGAPLNMMAGKLIGLALLLSFYYAMIRYAPTWIPSILNGFVETGAQGGMQSLNPSSILEQGLVIAATIFKGVHVSGLLTHPMLVIMASIISLTMIIIYGFIAAELTIILVKSYVLVALSSLFFALGGSDVTRGMTTRYFNAVLGVGFYLLTLYLLLGVGTDLGATWSKQIETSLNNGEMMPLFVMLASVIVFYLIIKNVPAFIGQLAGVRGLQNYGHAAVATAIGASATVTNAAVNTGRLLHRAYNCLPKPSGGGLPLGPSQQASGPQPTAPHTPTNQVKPPEK